MIPPSISRTGPDAAPFDPRGQPGRISPSADHERTRSCRPRARSPARCPRSPMPRRRRRRPGRSRGSRRRPSRPGPARRPGSAAATRREVAIGVEDMQLAAEPVGDGHVDRTVGTQLDGGSVDAAADREVIPGDARDGTIDSHGPPAHGTPVEVQDVDRGAIPRGATHIGDAGRSSRSSRHGPSTVTGHPAASPGASPVRWIRHLIASDRSPPQCPTLIAVSIPGSATASGGDDEWCALGHDR